jgi:diketogulonate reductase-like aldo/keto reductase
VARSDLHVTSKLPGRHHRFAEAIATVEESLYRAQLDHYDLYLIHWPNPAQGLYVEAWQALIEARRRGLVRSIGVSNFLPAHIEKIISETGVKPVVNQIELHPRFPQAEQLAFDKVHGIVTQAWSPLGRARYVLQEPLLQTIAARHHRSVGQVILRWHIQLGALPFPRPRASSARTRICRSSISSCRMRTWRPSPALRVPMVGSPTKIRPATRNSDFVDCLRSPPGCRQK